MINFVRAKMPIEIIIIFNQSHTHQSLSLELYIFSRKFYVLYFLYKKRFFYYYYLIRFN